MPCLQIAKDSRHLVLNKVARVSVNEISRIGVNSAKTFEAVPKDNTTTTTFPKIK
jgi:hypothetical protein